MARYWPWLGAFFAGSAATLLYGALSEANKLVVERHTLALPGWPAERNGFKVAVLGDLHLRDRYTVEHAQRAVEQIVLARPDVVAIVGDFVGYWKPESAWLIENALSDLAPLAGRIVAIPGNHDYWNGHASWLAPILKELGIVFLQNETCELGGVKWVGIDSHNELAADPFTTMLQVSNESAVIALWHEPDAVDWLPAGAALMLSGHSHGGQFRFPWGWVPKHTNTGRKYVEGFFPDAPTPLYVTRGLATTGPPSRLGALPEVSILTLVRSE